jgi:hypothetical protein
MLTTVRSTVCLVLAFSLSATFNAVSRAQGLPNLENHYTFDDQNNLAIDSSGNNRHGQIDETGLSWVLDAERGGVIELEGSTNGFIWAEIPELPADNFTIAFWAYRDPLLCCGAGGANDGMFHVQLDGETPGGPNTKVIGAWVNKASAAVWGRVIQEDQAILNLDQSAYIMEDEVWTHFAYRGDGTEYEVVINGVSGEGPSLSYDGTLAQHNTIFIGRQGTETWGGRLDDFQVYSRALSDDEIKQVMAGVKTVVLRAGDADMDLDFDQLDLVKVQIAGKYLTGTAATWGDGDWNGAPGGSPGSPPPGDARFDQLDIIAALAADTYLKGPYAAVRPQGQAGDGQTSIGYNPTTGEVFVDAPAGTQLTSINIDSAARIFTGAPAQNLGGSFDNDADNNIFKATFGSSFGSLTFGNVAQAGLSQQFVLNDLTAVGSLAGGGALGDVDLIYVPECSTFALLSLAMGIFLPAILRKPKA